jgi:hypothetical protein
VVITVLDYRLGFGHSDLVECEVADGGQPRTREDAVHAEEAVHA